MGAITYVSDNGNSGAVDWTLQVDGEYCGRPNSDDTHVSMNGYLMPRQDCRSRTQRVSTPSCWLPSTQYVPPNG